jgi:drug/metabolite transporter (DMT)-like permease
MNNPQFAGRIIALSAAIFYGFNTTLSRLAYDTGTTPVSLIVFRFLLTSLAMVILVAILRKSWRMQVSPRVFVLCVIGMYITSIGHLGAVRYIPVSLAAIIFYTFPLFVIAWKRLVGKQAVTIYELIGFVLAFVGLAIALGPEFHQMDITGLLLAFSGSLGATLFILSFERFPKDTDSWVGTLWINVGTLVLCGFSFLFGFELVPPKENIGWLYLTAIMVFSLISFVLSLQAIKKVGASVFALFLNFEPVVILLLAWMVIGEDLSVTRISGISMVVAALVISHWRGKAVLSRH